MSFTGNSGPKSKPLSRLLTANKQQEERSPSTSMWTPMFKARGPLYEYSIKHGGTEDVLFLSDDYMMLTHAYVTEWKTTNAGDSFAEKRFSTCTRHKLDDDGNSVDTGAQCLGCEAIGEPQLIVAFITAGTIPYVVNQKTIANPVRIFLASAGATRKWIADICSVSYVNGSLKNCSIRVGRSTKKTAPKVGDSFVFVDKYTDEVMRQWPIWPAIAAQMNGINPTIAYGPLTLAQQREALTRHVKVCDTHTPGKGYNLSVWSRILAGAGAPRPPETSGFGGFGAGTAAAVPAQPGFGNPGPVAGGLGALEEVESNDPPATEWNTPSEDVPF